MSYRLLVALITGILQVRGSLSELGLDSALFGVRGWHQPPQRGIFSIRRSFFNRSAQHTSCLMELVRGIVGRVKISHAAITGGCLSYGNAGKLRYRR